MTDRSAIVVPIKLPAALQPLRDASDPMAARGVPAHVTILFPFMGTAGLGPAERAALSVIAGTSRAFVAQFDRVELRDGMVWLLPTDQTPFLAMTAAILGRWPQFPPYEGAHETLIAHLTLVETDEVDVRDRVVSAAAEHGPFDADVTEVLLIAESGAGTWRTRWRFPLDAASGPGGRC